MKNILFPTDLSEASAQVLVFINNLAIRNNSRLTIFYVFTENYSPKRPFIEEGNIKQQSLNKLKNFVKEHIPTEKRKSINYKVKEGLITRNIIEETKSINYDMVIMVRSKSYDWITKMFGSRTSSISTSSYCPVMVIPPDFKESNLDNVLIAHPLKRKIKSNILDNLDRMIQWSYEKMEFPSNSNKSVKQGSEGITIRESLNPFQYDKTINQLKEAISIHGSNLIFLPLINNHSFDGIFMDYYGLRIILEMQVPVFVVNQNAYENILDQEESNSYLQIAV